MKPLKTMASGVVGGWPFVAWGVVIRGMTAVSTPFHPLLPPELLR
jgi:hypothetical protein